MRCSSYLIIVGKGRMWPEQSTLHSHDCKESRYCKMRYVADQSSFEANSENVFELAFAFSRKSYRRALSVRKFRDTA